jgi:hypothetical protein
VNLFSRLSVPLFLSVRRAVTAMKQRKSFHSGWRSASQLAPSSRQRRYSIRPWPPSVSISRA